MNKASLLTRAGATVAAVALLLGAPMAAVARAAARAAGAGRDAAEATPVDLTGASNGGAHVGGGGSIVRTIVGLAIVIGVIYGVAWVLRQVKASRQPRATGAGLASLASVPLGANRSVHLVRAGRDLVLLGVAEHAVVPIRTYTEDEACAAGLIDADGLPLLPDGEGDRSPARPRAPRRLPRLALPQLAQLALPSPPRTRPALPAGRRPGSALDLLRAWTVRG